MMVLPTIPRKIRSPVRLNSNNNFKNQNKTISSPIFFIFDFIASLTSCNTLSDHLLGGSATPLLNRK